MNDLKSRVFIVVSLVLLPIFLTQIIETKSDTVYMWWEKIILFFTSFLTYIGYCNWIYSVVFKNYNK